jgi:hypothetical protein
MVATASALTLFLSIGIGKAITGPGGQASQYACTPQPFTITYIHLDGSPASGPGPTVATVYHYKIAPSDDIREVFPPVGFDPVKAIDAELQAMGMPPRPTSPNARASWIAQYTHGWKGFKRPAAMCVMDQSNG